MGCLGGGLYGGLGAGVGARVGYGMVCIGDSRPILFRLSNQQVHDQLAQGGNAVLFVSQNRNNEFSTAIINRPSPPTQNSQMPAVRPYAYKPPTPPMDIPREQARHAATRGHTPGLRAATA